MYSGGRKERTSAYDLVPGKKKSRNPGHTVPRKERNSSLRRECKEINQVSASKLVSELPPLVIYFAKYRGPKA